MTTPPPDPNYSKSLSSGQNADAARQSAAFEKGKGIPFYFREFFKKYFTTKHDSKIRH